jgi:hypothetical protein
MLFALRAVVDGSIRGQVKQGLSELGRAWEESEQSSGDSHPTSDIQTFI